MSKYTKDEILDITAFADCGSKSAVTRLPYKIAVDIALNSQLPPPNVFDV